MNFFRVKAVAPLESLNKQTEAPKNIAPGTGLQVISATPEMCLLEDSLITLCMLLKTQFTHKNVMSISVSPPQD